jgi:Icc-related predicted phosphoesterase
MVTRLLHVCDFHGSNLLWSKLLEATSHYRADVVLVCGDLTGKAMVPIVEQQGGWFYNLWGKEEKITSKAELEKTKHRLSARGLYQYVTTIDEVRKLQKDPQAVDAIFARLMKERIADWLADVPRRVSSEVKLVVSPGNDDILDIDSLLEESPHIIYPLGRVVDLDDKHQLISCEWVNDTPWDTPRECSERQLKERLMRELKRVGDYDNLLCSLHAPPYNTHLDWGPTLSSDLQPKAEFGGAVMQHVGSKAVREAIEEFQPLVTLHGHIHESSGFDRIGRTYCFNPGSEYESGVLRGYLLELPGDGQKLEFIRVEV